MVLSVSNNFFSFIYKRKVVAVLDATILFLPLSHLQLFLFLFEERDLIYIFLLVYFYFTHLNACFLSSFVYFFFTHLVACFLSSFAGSRGSRAPKFYTKKAEHGKMTGN